LLQRRFSNRLRADPAQLRFEIPPLVVDPAQPDDQRRRATRCEQSDTRYSGGLVGRNPAVPVIDGEAHGLLDGSRVETGNRGLSPSRSIAVLAAI
jgi:hypothetical protein